MRTAPDTVVRAAPRLRAAAWLRAMAALALAGCGTETPPPADPGAADHASSTPVGEASRAPTDQAAPVLRVPGPRFQGPHLRIEDTTFEWGTTTAGQSMRHTFVLRNDGSETVRIDKAKPN